jgi:hypothetical protein
VLLLVTALLAGCGGKSAGGARSAAWTDWANTNVALDPTTVHAFDCNGGGPADQSDNGDAVYLCEVYHGFGNIDANYCVTFDSSNAIAGDPRVTDTSLPVC